MGREDLQAGLIYMYIYIYIHIYIYIIIIITIVIIIIIMIVIIMIKGGFAQGGFTRSCVFVLFCMLFNISGTPNSVVPTRVHNLLHYIILYYSMC